MNPSIASARDKWRATEPGTRVMLFVGIAAVVVAGLLVQSRLNQVEWGVLYANVDDVTASEVLAGLDSRGIQYRVEGNGTRILVPKDQIATTRVALAGDGISGSAVPQGFDDLFPSSGLGSSDRQEQINYQRALEGELARTLLAMDAISGARVQLSIPEPTLFVGSGAADAAKPTASVMLELRRDLSRSEVDAIANLVASAVPDLTTDAVTIASSDGALLKSPTDATDASAGVQENLQFQSDYETSMATRLTDLVRTLTGRDDATVAVHAEMDFTQSTTEDVTVTSDTIVSRQDVTLETWNGTGSNPNGAVGTDGGPGASTTGDGTYTKEHRVSEATPINSTTQQITSLTPTLKALHVAVVVPETGDTANATGAGVTQEELQSFVENAAGLNKNGRVDDTISVKLDAPAAAVTDGTGLVADDGTGTGTDAPVANAQELPTDLLVIAGCGGAFVMLLLSLIGRRSRRRAKKEAKALEKAMRGGGKKKRKKGDPELTEIMPVMPVQPLPSDPERVAADEIKRDLERMVSESPESLAALLSTWMAK